MLREVTEKMSKLLCMKAVDTEDKYLEPQKNDQMLLEEEKILQSTQTQGTFLVAATESEKCEESTKAKKEEFKTAVRILIRSLVLLIVEKSKIPFYPNAWHDISDRLFNEIWPEIEDEDFNIPPENGKKLDKAIVKGICKKWGRPEFALFSLNITLSIIDDTIFSSVKEHLKTASENHCTNNRFFLSFLKSTKSLSDIWKMFW